MDALLLGMLNTPEIIALMVLALILFGAKKLPELAKGLGHGIREFRKASREISDELNTSLHEDPVPPRKTSSSPTPSSPEGTEPQSPDAYAAELEEADKTGEGTETSTDESAKEEAADKGTAGTDPESKPHVTKI